MVPRANKQRQHNMARNNKATAAAPVAAKPAPMLLAAKLLGRTGLAAAPAIAAKLGTAPASQRRYGATVHGLTPSFATATFTLTALGKSTVGQAGCIGRNGQPTAMGLTAVALANAANGGNSATGAAIVAAILGNPQLMAAMGGTKALGTHVTPNSATAAKWAQGYVNGLCRPAHGLATKALA
jgi:hypothetical protein